MNREMRVVYAAGFFDGEGCVSISAHPDRAVIGRITAPQKVRAPLDVLHELWPTSYIEPIYRGSQEYHLWRMNGQQAVIALTEMLPYLIVKKEKAEQYIHCFGLKTGAERRSWLRELLGDNR